MNGDLGVLGFCYHEQYCVDIVFSHLCKHLQVFITGWITTWLKGKDICAVQVLDVKFQSKKFAYFHALTMCVNASLYLCYYWVTSHFKSFAHCYVVWFCVSWSKSKQVHTCALVLCTNFIFSSLFPDHPLSFTNFPSLLQVSC